jgi:hypothetical protein
MYIANRWLRSERLLIFHITIMHKSMLYAPYRSFELLTIATITERIASGVSPGQTATIEDYHRRL